MPRERIYGSLTPFGEEDPERTVADVSWSREAQYVQLGVIAIDGVTGEPVDLGERSQRYATSAQVAGGGSDGELPIIGIAGGMYMQLDRRACNDLIRKIRRARDQAFGRDEETRCLGCRGGACVAAAL